MENIFSVEFYPSNADIEEVWKNSFIIFDTCSLLNLYKYSKKTREQYLNVLKQVEDRLWLPYQIGAEYFENRANTIIGIEISYDKIVQKLKEQFERLREELKQIKFCEDVEEELQKGFQKLKEAIVDKQKDRISFSPATDPILKELKRLYKNKVGQNFTIEKLAEIRIEGDDRFEKQIPPGYCDRDKDDMRKNKYGDLIIWKQIMEQSICTKKNIIFVTDDGKEDWWLKIQNRTISPRKELYSEFINITKQKILIYRPKNFMNYAKDNLKSRVDAKTIDEIVNISALHGITDYTKNLMGEMKQPFSMPDYLKSTGNLSQPVLIPDHLKSIGAISEPLSVLDSYRKNEDNPFSYLNYLKGIGSVPKKSFNNENE